MVDKSKIEEAVKLLLEGIGEDVDREGLRETPVRIARMYEEIFGGMDEDPAVPLSKQFQAENAGIVLEKDITFYSTCEHHLMPFFGKAHVAYLPAGKVVGLSKLARTVEIFARRPQLQEKLTARWRMHDGLSSAQGRNDNAGGGAYVHDHARSQKAGQ